MSSRYRQSTAQPTPGRPAVAATPSSSRHNFNNELPPYKKPSHQLNNQAQAKLRAIYSTSTSNNLAAQNKAVAELITTAAGTINDLLRDRTERIERRRKKWAQGQRVGDQKKEEAELAELQEKVNDMTKKLEESMRGVIDTGIAAQRVEECLTWVRENASTTQNQEYATQMSQRQSLSQSQAASQRPRRGDDEDEDEEDEQERPTPGPTPLTQARVALTGPSEMFTSRLERKKEEYITISHGTRYSKNNSYIGFKSVVHDAKYGDNEAAPPLPHPDTWFTERGSPAPGITATQGGEDEDDDDIVVDRATVSIRCPITFQTFKEPYSSRKCPHSFEKTAILQMIRQSRNKAIACPVTGCQQTLSKDDLHEDFILNRKIKRMQQAEQRAGEDSEDDDDGNEPAPRKKLKQEHRGGNVDKMPTRVKSEVLDLGSPSGDDDE